MRSWRRAPCHPTTEWRKHKRLLCSGCVCIDAASTPVQSVQAEAEKKANFGRVCLPVFSPASPTCTLCITQAGSSVLYGRGGSSVIVLQRCCWPRHRGLVSVAWYATDPTRCMRAVGNVTDAVAIGLPYMGGGPVDLLTCFEASRKEA